MNWHWHWHAHTFLSMHTLTLAALRSRSAPRILPTVTRSTVAFISRQIANNLFILARAYTHSLCHTISPIKTNKNFLKTTVDRKCIYQIEKHTLFMHMSRSMKLIFHRVICTRFFFFFLLLLDNFPFFWEFCRRNVK